jgi:primosomal protein N' (replication factor Y)
VNQPSLLDDLDAADRGLGRADDAREAVPKTTAARAGRTGAAAARRRSTPARGAGAALQPGERIARVLPEGSIDKTFDYVVPAAMAADVRVGTLVRVELHGRRVAAWVVADDVDVTPDLELRPIAKVTGWGPRSDVVDLTSWAAWRWAGRRASFLTTASPDTAVRGLPRAPGPRPPAVTPAPAELGALVDAALARPRAVLRLPPCADTFPVVAAAAARGNALVLAPSIAEARRLGVRLRRSGVRVAIMPDDWAAARAGAVVVGSRAAAWAPVLDLAAVVVLDEHDEVYQEERAPTWHARDVVVERAARAGAPCVLVSPAPTLEALDLVRPGDGDDGADRADRADQAGGAGLLRPSRSAERDGWPVVDVVDRRDEDPARAGLYSERLVRALDADGRIVCVLNRKGRSRLLVCGTCGATARCEHCDAAVVLDDEGLVCPRCGTRRPEVCQACGGTRLKNLRVGVGRAREELEALAREPVIEVTGTMPVGGLPDARIYVGTEAVLHQVPDAAVVAFLDLDQELAAPRYRAAEQAFALLVRAARLLGRRAAGPGLSGTASAGRSTGGRAALGRLLLQTRWPDHDVIQAALHADPDRLSSVEAERRALLRFPPVTAMAEISGAGAEDVVAGLAGAQADGVVEIGGPTDGHWLVRAADHGALCDALAAVPRPSARVRVAVDPLRV